MPQTVKKMTQQSPAAADTKKTSESKDGGITVYVSIDQTSKKVTLSKDQCNLKSVRESLEASSVSSVRKSLEASSVSLPKKETCYPNWYV
jgi:hypothetical protein